MQICINFAPEGGERKGGGGSLVEKTRRSGATAFRGRQFRTTAWRSSHAFPRFSVCSCGGSSLSRSFSRNPLASFESLSPFPPALGLSSCLFYFVVAALPYPRFFNSRTRGRARSILFLSVSLNLLVSIFLFLLCVSSFLFSLEFSLTRCTRAKMHACL